MSIVTSARGTFHHVFLAPQTSPPNITIKKSFSTPREYHNVTYTRLTSGYTTEHTALHLTLHNEDISSK